MSWQHLYTSTTFNFSFNQKFKSYWSLTLKSQVLLFICYALSHWDQYSSSIYTHSKNPSFFVSGLGFQYHLFEKILSMALIMWQYLGEGGSQFPPSTIPTINIYYAFRISDHAVELIVPGQAIKQKSSRKWQNNSRINLEQSAKYFLNFWNHIIMGGGGIRAGH